jgi:hypothetical protein
VRERQEAHATKISKSNGQNPIFMKPKLFPIQSKSSGVVVIVSSKFQELSTSIMKMTMQSILKTRVSSLLFVISCLLLVYLGIVAKVMVNDLATFEDDRAVFCSLSQFHQRSLK